MVEPQGKSGEGQKVGLKMPFFKTSFSLQLEHLSLFVCFVCIVRHLKQKVPGYRKLLLSLK